MKKGTVVFLICIVAATLFALYMCNGYFEIADLEKQATLIEMNIERLKTNQKTIVNDLTDYAEKIVTEQNAASRCARSVSIAPASLSEASGPEELIRLLDSMGIKDSAYDELRLRYNNSCQQLTDDLTNYNQLAENYNEKAFSSPLLIVSSISGRKPLAVLDVNS